jgi:hypothetical protein
MPVVCACFSLREAGFDHDWTRQRQALKDCLANFEQVCARVWLTASNLFAFALGRPYRDGFRVLR